jgi:hypothetical protein
LIFHNERFSAICPTEEDLNGQYKFFYDRMGDWVKRDRALSSQAIRAPLDVTFRITLFTKKRLKAAHGNYLVLEDDWAVNPEVH